MSHGQYFSLLRDFDARYPSSARAGLAKTQEIVVAGRTARVWHQADADLPDEGMLLCNIDVLHLSAPPDLELCRALLQANNLWAGTRGTTIGLRGNDVVMLSAARGFPYAPFARCLATRIRTRCPSLAGSPHHHAAGAV
jgi:hypothetical protein